MCRSGPTGAPRGPCVCFGQASHQYRSAHVGSWEEKPTSTCSVQLIKAANKQLYQISCSYEMFGGQFFKEYYKANESGGQRITLLVLSQHFFCCQINFSGSDSIIFGISVD